MREDFLKGGETLLFNTVKSSGQVSKRNNPNKTISKNKEDSFMSSSRKVVSLIVVLVMVFSLMAPALAATPTDVVGTPYEDSVGKLVALGILQGYPDGSYKPDQNITRAEFAKIAVMTMGLGQAADLSKGSTRFKDVSSSHWASGLINIAAEKGLIKGYPDGTFQPEANVSYAEAITILVRALGLGAVVEGKGTWPANYLSKASEAGVTDDVAGIDGNSKAIRGVIAQLSWNTLTAEKWGEKEYTSDGVVYGPLGKTLIEEKFADFVYKDSNGKYLPKFFEDVIVAGTQLGGLGENQIQLQSTGIADANHLNITATTDVPRRVGDADHIIVEAADGIETLTLLGKKVDVMFGKDNEVVSLKVKSDSAQAGIVDDINTTDNKITIAGKEYSLATSPAATITINCKAYANLAAADTAIGESTATAAAVLNDDGVISTLNLFVADTNAGFNTTQFVVKEVQSDTDVVSLQTGGVMFNLNTITDKDKTNGNKAVIVKNGKTATRDDIKAGDVVTYVQLSGSLYYMQVSDNKVTGTLDSVTDDSTSGVTRYSLTIGGKAYAMPADGNARMTKSGNANDKVVIDSSIADFLGKEITLSLNVNGEAVLVSGTVTASTSAEYGMLTKAAWQSTSPDSDGKLPTFVEVRTSAGEKRVFKIKGDKIKTEAGDGSIPGTAATTLTFDGSKNSIELNAAGMMVQYRVDADGTINAANLVKLNDAIAGSDTASKFYAVPVTPALSDMSNEAKSITVSGTSYYVNTATVIYNKSVANGEYEKVDGWDKIITGDTDATNLLDDGANVYIIYDNDTKIIKTLLVDTATYLGSTAKFGVVTSLKYADNSDGTTKWKIKIFNEGTDTTYEVATNVYDSTVAGYIYTVNVGDLVRYTVDSDGKFVGGSSDADRSSNFLVDKSRISENKDNLFDNYVVDTVNSADRLVYFKGIDGVTRSIKVTSDVKVYDVTGTTPVMASLSDIQENYMVAEVNHADAKDGVMYKYLVIIKK